MKEQIRAGVKTRNEILESGKIENPSVLTQCILECQELNINGKTQFFDYCIYFVYKIVEALIQNENCILNRFSHLVTYYGILDNLFKIDMDYNPELKEEVPNPNSIFGSGPKLESY